MAENKEARDITEAEKKVIESLISTMAKTGSDFTDTFRILGLYSAVDDNR